MGSFPETNNDHSDIPESWKFFLVESGILGFGILNTAQGIRNPMDD